MNLNELLSFSDLLFRKTLLPKRAAKNTGGSRRYTGPCSSLCGQFLTTTLFCTGNFRPCWKLVVLHHCSVWRLIVCFRVFMLRQISSSEKKFCLLRLHAFQGRQSTVVHCCLDVTLCCSCSVLSQSIGVTQQLQALQTQPELTVCQ